MTIKTEKNSGNPLSALMELAQEEKASRGLLHTPAEIAQQPETWQGTYARVDRQKSALREFLGVSLSATTTVYLIGAGTSDYIGRALCSVLRQKWQCDVIAVPSTELITNLENYVLPRRNYLWISFSRSGDSSEGVGVLDLAITKYPAIRHLIVGCNKDGKMAQMCADRDNCYVLLLDDATNDRGLAMTSSFTNMVIAGHCLANIDDLSAYRPLVESLIGMAREMLHVAPPIALEISKLRLRKACYVGSGAQAATATECALKTVEMSAGTIHTMAESTMGLRHGPMSALGDDSLFVAFVSSDERRQRYELDLIKEIHRKQLGRVRVAIAPPNLDELVDYCEHVITLDAPPDFPDDYRVPVDVIFGQLVGLFSSIQAGLQPDRPSPNGAITRVVSDVNIYLD
ncbi:galactosamine 6-phosphate isomerase AgaS [Candidatus Koribacter versatilis Ellin345]|uniref:Galactosamine 6-phosphate isomerase AgaS n=1 Tax=Koribacter versatilis (strain Ellin345) TaxID=204669 RepID=Q1ITY0_KORVE|nr:SIS domain-containing protein [Candidatus Koribacter versatilis]ABF39670.1 galactosamine 6-phosphate isomerase AgaS [Candidatus Koribacter versatilis Ellin345]